jgi:pyruvate-formate lyase
VLLDQVQQPPGAAQGRGHGRRRAAPTTTSPTSTSAACCRDGGDGGQRGLVPHARGHRRDAPAAAVQGNIQLARRTRDRFLKAACRVIRKGYGYPSVFNADAVVAGAAAQGKTLEDAREGGTSGCVETGAFGKEAYILTGYLNLPKLLELALHDGVDPRTGRSWGRAPATRDVRDLGRRLFEAWRPSSRTSSTSSTAATRSSSSSTPSRHAGAVPVGAHRRLHRRRAATTTPAARATTRPTSRAWASAPHRQPVGPQAPRLRRGELGLAELLAALDATTSPASEPLRQRLLDRTPRYGNDDDRADEIMVRCFEVVASTPSTAGPTPRGGRTTSTCCRPPATSTSARSARPRPTAAAPAAAERGHLAGPGRRPPTAPPR